MGTPVLVKPNTLIDGYTSAVSALLAARGITTPEAADTYLHAGYEDLRDPMTAKCMPEAVSLCVSAIREKKKIKIFADYDCDGATSGTILEGGLLRAGADVSVRFPCRLLEGYGISMNAVKELVAENIDLIITVDNGIRACEEIRYAEERGVKVIVLDHHIIGDTMPPADVVIDMHRADETFGYADLAGCGVAFNFVRALYSAMGIPDSEAKQWLDLAAIGTVADCVPLTGENRIIVKEGLKIINSKTYARRGILAIIRQNFITGHVTSSDIGFKIAPVINAPGRLLEHGADRAHRMLTDENGCAEDEASFLMRINEERKELTKDGVDAAERSMKADGTENDRFIVMYLPKQPEGIIGLIAGRLTEKYWRPSVVFTDAAGGTLKASGRSIPGVNLYECLSSCISLFVRMGGHEQAAGMTIEKENFAALKKGLNLFADDNYTDAAFVRPETYECETDEEGVNTELAERLALVEPCGQDNPKPRILVREFSPVVRKVKNGEYSSFVPIGADSSSLKLFGQHADALVFGGMKAYEDAGRPPVLDLLGTLETRWDYTGNVSYSILADSFTVPDTRSSGGSADGELKSRLADLAALL